MTRYRALWRRFGSAAYFITWPLIYVYVVITTARARVLLVHNDDILVVKNWLGAGNWALPGGGLERGESAQQATIREVKEELGIAIEQAALIDLGRHSSNSFGHMPSKYYLFAVQLQERPQLTVQESEITAHDWLSTRTLVEQNRHVARSTADAVQ